MDKHLLTLDRDAIRFLPPVFLKDSDDLEDVKRLEKKYPGAMPYFFSQDPDYVTVKERVSKFCAKGEEAKGVATIEVAVETMRIAEYLEGVLKTQLM